MSPLKRKILLEYQKLVRHLQLGYKMDYTHILDMISFTEVGSKTNSPGLLYNHFINL